MALRVYLHIGMNKTGTSAIQRFLASQPGLLAREGAVYPLAGRRGDAHYGLSRALGFAHGPRADPGEGREPLRKALRAEIAASGAGSVLLSSEDFVLHGDIEAAGDFLAGFDCRIVVYLRRHDHWWLSVYNQAVRMVANPPWQSGLPSYIQFCRRRRNAPGRYRDLLERWAAVFGAGNLCVRPFEEQQNPGGVVADFLHTVGLPQAAAVAPDAAQRVNTSLGFEALYLMDLVQRANLADGTRERLKTRLLALDEAPGTTASLMRPRLRRRLIAENAEDYAFIARKYLGREDGVLFREPLPAEEPAWTAPQVPDPVHVVSRLIGLLEPAG